MSEGVEMKGMKSAPKGAYRLGKKLKAKSAPKGARLDFKRAGAEGAYRLVKRLKDAALNKAMDKLIEEADAMRALTLKQCQQGQQVVQ